MELGQAAGSLDLLVGHVRVGQGEVVADRRVEQVDPLGHDAEQAPGVVGPQLAEVAAADEDLALREVPEPEQQVDERRLARAARADDRQAAAGRHREADVVQDRPAAGVVAEGDAPDVHGQARPQRTRHRRNHGHRRALRRAAGHRRSRRGVRPPPGSRRAAGWTTTGAEPPRTPRWPRAAAARGTRRPACRRPRAERPGPGWQWHTGW